MAEKRIGHGNTITLGGTTLSQIRNFTLPTFARDEVPSTTLDSTVEETLPADPESVGEFAFEQVWQSGDTNHQLIDTDFNARTIGSYTVVLSSLTTTRTGSFSAWVKSIGYDQNTGKGVLARSVVLKLTTTISWA